MSRYAAASALSLGLAAVAGAFLSVVHSHLAATDARLWLDYGAAGFALSGLGIGMLRPRPIAVPSRWTLTHILLMLSGILLLSAPAAGSWGLAHRFGWLPIAAAASVYAYVVWWHPPIGSHMPEPLEEFVAPGHRPNPSDLQHDTVARAMLGAAPAYLFLVAVAGLTGSEAIGPAAQAMLLFGWLGSAAVGTAQAFWPRLLARRLGVVHLARWGGILWHGGVLLAALSGQYWLLALSGAGCLLLIADFSNCLHGALRSRPYVVGSRRRYPERGARVGFVLATLGLGAVAAATVFDPWPLLGARAVVPAWILLVTLPLLHHLRPNLGPQVWHWPPLGLWAGLAVALASPFLLASSRLAGAAVAIAGLLLAVSWLPGIPLREQRPHSDRRRTPVG